MTEIRTVSDDELTAFRTCILTTFGDDIDADPDGESRMRALIPPTQRWAAFERNVVVATAGTFDHVVGLPGGGSLPMAGLTIVTVRPTHRRRGLLRELMKCHFEDARRRGFPISGLWASEAGIYGRFGYGISAWADAISIENAHALKVRGPADDALEPIDEPAARELLPDVYARATALRPGVLRRSDTWWRERRFLDAPFVRGGGSKRRHVLARRGGEPVGYLVYRHKGGFDPSRPSGRVEINELIGIDTPAELSLWRLATSVDLFPNVGWWNAPIDDPLAWSVDDPRRVQRRRTDGLWLRIEDIPVALAARHYALDGTLTFAAEGDTWELVVEGGRGRCAKSTRAPELELAPTVLASIYLGGASLHHLARANLVRGEANALTLADRMFASSLAPWCPEVF